MVPDLTKIQLAAFMKSLFDDPSIASRVLENAVAVHVAEQLTLPNSPLSESDTPDVCFNQQSKLVSELISKYNELYPYNVRGCEAKIHSYYKVRFNVLYQSVNDPQITGHPICDLFGVSTLFPKEDIELLTHYEASFFKVRQWLIENVI